MTDFTMPSEAKKRWEAFWECDVHDRPVLLTWAPPDNRDPIRPLPPGKSPAAPLTPPEGRDARELYDRWFDIDHMIARNLADAAGRLPGSDSTMQFDTKWSVAYCMPFGVECAYNEHAAWCEPLEGTTCASDFYFDFGGGWFKWLYEGTRRIVEAGKGLYYSTPVMWGNHSADTLSNLVGLDRLMYDCADDPGSVRRALETVTDAQIKAFDMLRELEQGSGLPGTRNYTGAWSPKVGLSFDCDVSAMVSPAMYREIFLPPLERMMATVDHRIYHLDGPVCLQHLPTLLGLPQLQAIQWVPGAGHDEITDWLDLCDTIQSAGKSLFIYAAHEQVPELCRRLKPEGLAIGFWSPSAGAMYAMEERIEAMFRG